MHAHYAYNVYHVQANSGMTTRQYHASVTSSASRADKLRILESLVTLLEAASIAENCRMLLQCR